VPTHYISEDGVRHPYTATEASDPVLQWLIRPTTISLSDRTPLSMNIHLKISKEFYKYFTLSIYVNNLFNFYEDYRVNRQYINRRGLINPYFGMEMNISLGKSKLAN
jgi:tonB-dependent receptor plug